MILKGSSRGQGHIKVKVIQGKGHLKVTVILRSGSFWNQMVMCFDFYPEAGGWLSAECLSLLVIHVFGPSEKYSVFHYLPNTGSFELSTTITKPALFPVIFICVLVIFGCTVKGRMGTITSFFCFGYTLSPIWYVKLITAVSFKGSLKYR